MLRCGAVPRDMAIGRGAGRIDPAPAARPAIAENSRALLTRAAPLRTGVTGGDVGFRAALLDTEGPQPIYPNLLKGTLRRGTATPLEDPFGIAG